MTVMKTTPWQKFHATAVQLALKLWQKRQSETAGQTAAGETEARRDRERERGKETDGE